MPKWGSLLGLGSSSEQERIKRELKKLEARDSLERLLSDKSIKFGGGQFDEVTTSEDEDPVDSLRRFLRDQGGPAGSEITPLQAAGVGFAKNIAPGLIGTGAMGLTALSGGAPLAAAGVGIGAGMGSGALQEKLLHGTELGDVGEEAQQEHPWAYGLGSLGTQVLSGARPSWSGLKAAGGVGRAALGAGIGAGVPAVSALVQGQTPDLPSVAIGALGGATLNKAWGIGPSLGMNATKGKWYGPADDIRATAYKDLATPDILEAAAAEAKSYANFGGDKRTNIPDYFRGMSDEAYTAALRDPKTYEAAKIKLAQVEKEITKASKTYEIAKFDSPESAHAMNAKLVKLRTQKDEIANWLKDNPQTFLEKQLPRDAAIRAKDEKGKVALGSALRSEELESQSAVVESLLGKSKQEEAGLAALSGFRSGARSERMNAVIKLASSERGGIEILNQVRAAVGDERFNNILEAASKERSGVAVINKVRELARSENLDYATGLLSRDVEGQTNLEGLEDSRRKQTLESALNLFGADEEFRRANNLPDVTQGGQRRPASATGRALSRRGPSGVGRGQRGRGMFRPAESSGSFRGFVSEQISGIKETLGDIWDSLTTRAKAHTEDGVDLGRMGRDAGESYEGTAKLGAAAKNLYTSPNKTTSHQAYNDATGSEPDFNVSPGVNMPGTTSSPTMARVERDYLRMAGPKAKNVEISALQRFALIPSQVSTWLERHSVVGRELVTTTVKTDNLAASVHQAATQKLSKILTASEPEFIDAYPFLAQKISVDKVPETLTYEENGKPVVVENFKQKYANMLERVKANDPAVMVPLVHLKSFFADMAVQQGITTPRENYFPRRINRDDAITQLETKLKEARAAKTPESNLQVKGLETLIDRLKSNDIPWIPQHVLNEMPKTLQVGHLKQRTLNLDSYDLNTKRVLMSYVKDASRQIAFNKYGPDINALLGKMRSGTVPGTNGEIVNLGPEAIQMAGEYIANYLGLSNPQKYANMVFENEWKSLIPAMREPGYRRSFQDSMQHITHLWFLAGSPKSIATNLITGRLYTALLAGEKYALRGTVKQAKMFMNPKKYAADIKEVEQYGTVANLPNHEAAEIRALAGSKSFTDTLMGLWTGSEASNRMGSTLSFHEQTKDLWNLASKRPGMKLENVPDEMFIQDNAYSKAEQLADVQSAVNSAKKNPDAKTEFFYDRVVRGVHNTQFSLGKVSPSISSIRYPKLTKMLHMYTGWTMKSLDLVWNRMPPVAKGKYVMYMSALAGPTSVGFISLLNQSNQFRQFVTDVQSGKLDNEMPDWMSDSVKTITKVALQTNLAAATGIDIAGSVAPGLPAVTGGAPGAAIDPVRIAAQMAAGPMGSQVAGVAQRGYQAQAALGAGATMGDRATEAAKGIGVGGLMSLAPRPFNQIAQAFGIGETAPAQTSAGKAQPPRTAMSKMKAAIAGKSISEQAYGNIPGESMDLQASRTALNHSMARQAWEKVKWNPAQIKNVISMVQQDAASRGTFRGEVDLDVITGEFMRRGTDSTKNYLHNDASKITKGDSAAIKARANNIRFLRDKYKFDPQLQSYVGTLEVAQLKDMLYRAKALKKQNEVYAISSQLLARGEKLPVDFAVSQQGQIKRLTRAMAGADINSLTKSAKERTTLRKLLEGIQ